MTKILITAYENPDLDGTACAFAYAEFLNHINESENQAIAATFGQPEPEAQFVFSTFLIPDMQSGEKLIDSSSQIILVDASDKNGLARQIDVCKIVEIIDHRKITQAHAFPNAKIQIELVGAAATLIAEKFFEKKLEPSTHSAALLYSAIVSNTINFKAKVTTERDTKMAEWLLTRFALPQNFVNDMFAHKSQFTRPIIEIMRSELATSFGGYPLAISQLEIVDAQQFVEKHLDEIKNALALIQQELKSKYIFLTIIDIEKTFNLFVCNDKNTQTLIESALDVKFDNNIAKYNDIIMRKEIVPILIEKLSKSVN